MTNHITTESGATVALPDHVDPATVLGVDADGRIVVQLDWMDYGFGLTLCCQSFDKGCEDGVYCRVCYGGAPDADEGYYHFPERGVFHGVDLVV